MYAQQHIYILGFGASGQAAAELAAGEDCKVTVFDERNTPQQRREKSRLEGKGCSVHLGVSPAALPASMPDLCVISPGIGENGALGQYAEYLDCPVVSELEFGFRYCRCPLIAVTGTNGKTTTVEMIAHTMRLAGRRVQTAGNIGIPLARAAVKSHELDWLVVEVSSFQLMRVAAFCPAVAVILNISPDHLDRHHHFVDYVRTKARIFQNLQRSDRVVIRADLATMSGVADNLPGEGSGPVIFAGDEQSAADFFLDHHGYICSKRPSSGIVRFDTGGLPVWGLHNLENVLATVAACASVGVDPAHTVAALHNFDIDPHRLEIVGKINGVYYINDSKATNPDAMCRALEAVTERFRAPIVLIAGGLDKDLNYADIALIIPDVVKRVYLIGACRRKLAEEWRKRTSCTVCESLEEAVQQAGAAAASGEVVLLAPGCASQDMFKDYKERGERFRKAVTEGVENDEIFESGSF